MKFSDVLGQKSLKENLINSAKKNRVSHAQLFLGPEGAGGLPLAMAFATYLTCKSPGDDACGECSSCNKMSKVIHPDVHFSYPFISPKTGTVSLDYISEWRQAIISDPYLNYYDWLLNLKAENKQGNITAKESREIIRKLSLKSYEGGPKIMIIWLPEYLGREGNALLKILEEPPENTFFFLVAENAENILNTILSRTQLVRVPKLKDEDIQEALVAKHGIEQEEAMELAAIADGNYLYAKKLAVSTETNYSAIFQEWMRHCYKPDGVRLLKWVDSIAKFSREEQKNFLKYGLQMLEEIFKMGYNLGKGSRLSSEDQLFAEKFSEYINEQTFVRIYEEMNKTHFYVERNASSKIAFFNLSLRINSFFQKQTVPQ